MHTGVDITCFFQDVKSSLTKHTVFWKRVMEPVKHLSCSLLQKKLTAYSRKQFPQKKSTLDVWEGSKEYQLLLWWILPQILTPPLNLKIWCRTPAPFLITHPPLSTIKLLRIQISKTGFRKLSIMSKIWDWRKWQGVGDHLVCFIMTHCVRKSICDSLLNHFIKNELFTKSVWGFLPGSHASLNYFLLCMR